MADFQPIEVTVTSAPDFRPIEREFEGHRVLTGPPNTSGFILLRALAAIDAGQGAGDALDILEKENIVVDKQPLTTPRLHLRQARQKRRPTVWIQLCRILQESQIDPHHARSQRLQPALL